MSLDVSLLSAGHKCPECGHVDRLPGVDRELFARNITHNLREMAGAAGLYTCLWRPEECDPPIRFARDLVGPLTEGLARLGADPERFRALSPSNGWGTYEGLVWFVAAYLEACEYWPDAEVRVWR